jgi:enterochelin esterase-like enzyme
LTLRSKILPTIFGAIWLLTLLSNPTQAQSGSLFVRSFFSQQLNRDWNYKIYLPKGYEDDTILNYPVIYLLHGSEGDENSWDFIFPVIDSLISRNVIPPFITIVPATGTSWWVDTSTDAYESAFTQDLIPEIDEKYRTIKDRRGRGVVGFSMGGYGALRYALGYSEIFSTAMILSAAIYHDLPPKGSSARTSGIFGKPFDDNVWKQKNYPVLLEDYFKKELFVPIFIATGDDDWHHQEDFLFNVEQQAVYLYGKLNKEGGSPAELRIVDGGHTEEVWKKTFVEGIQYMFRYLEQSE